VDEDYRGGWTQIFGGKASEPKTSRPVEKRILPHLYLALGVTPLEFRRDLLHHKARAMGYLVALFL